LAKADRAVAAAAAHDMARNVKIFFDVDGVLIIVTRDDAAAQTRRRRPARG